MRLLLVHGGALRLAGARHDPDATVVVAYLTAPRTDNHGERNVDPAITVRPCVYTAEFWKAIILQSWPRPRLTFFSPILFSLSFPLPRPPAFARSHPSGDLRN